MERPVIIVDTREQRPLFLDSNGQPKNGYKTLATFVRCGLKYGDYSLQGFEDMVAIERKSIPDLLESLGAHHERFAKELSALSQFPRAYIVVEGDQSDFTGLVSLPNFRKQYRTLISTLVHYGIPIQWARTPEEAERFVFVYLTTFLKYFREGRLC